MKITYYDGIKANNPSRYLTLQEIYELIKTSPNVGLIETIRLLKSNNDSNYRDFKLRLPIITPHVEAAARRLSGGDFDKNLKSFTQLMYFDIDNVQNVHEEKQRIINQYKDFITLVCISPSGAGISIFIQVENELTKDNFNTIWNAIRMNELAKENIDVKANGIARTMFLSSDPDVYFNPDATLAVNYKEDEKEGNELICISTSNNIVNSHITNGITTKSKYKIYNIDFVLNQLKTKTVVEVEDKILDFKEVDYKAIYIPKKIGKGKRHKALTAMIVILYNLNPNIETDIIFSFIWYVNNVFVAPKLQVHDLLQHFNYVINKINTLDSSDWFKKTKRVHFNKDCWYLTSNDKMMLAKKLTGLYKRHQNKQRIDEAIQKLTCAGQKITNVAIKKLTGMDVKTIRNHRRTPDIDLELEISSIIDEYSKFNPTQLSA